MTDQTAAPTSGRSNPEEFLEIVDSDNRIVGREERNRAHEEGLPHKSAHIAVFDREGRLYIQKRAASKSVLPGHWDVSAAGHLEPGESYVAGARRELKEELGIEAPLRLLYVSEARPETGNEFAALFVAQTRDDIRPDSTEIEQGEWVTLAELAQRLADPGEDRFAPNLANAAIVLAANPEFLPSAARTVFEEDDESAIGEDDSERVRTIEAALRRQTILPWPGVPCHRPTLEAIVRDAEFGPLPATERFLERFVIVGIVAAAFLAVLAYPWSLDMQERIRTEYGPGGEKSGTWTAWLFYDQIYPLISSIVDPLPLKETFVSVIVLAALPLFVLLILLRPGRRLLRVPWALLIGGFLLYAGLSVLLRVPDASMYMGVYTFMRLITWVALLAMIVHCVRTPRRVRVMLWLTAIPLALMAFGALTQHFGWWTILPTNFTSVRNRLSSTIGHNNGVAGLLMFAWFPLLAALFRARTALGRIASGAAFGIVVFLIIALQTRGVWLVLLVTTPPFLWLALRNIDYRLQLRHGLMAAALLLLAVLLQSIESPLNPFSGPVAFTERLQGLAPETLKTTTQRRILTAALAYMPKEPTRYALGTGLGSFAYVYPEMQAEYYARTMGESDVLLRAKRTLQAHSDVLQLFIEMGFLGLIFFFVAIYLLARHMERAYRATASPRARLLQLGIFFPVVATILHAMGDFPFHVASTTTIFTLFFGMTLAAHRIWAPGLVELPTETGLQREFRAAGPRAAVIRTAILVGVLLLYLPAAILALQNQRALVASTLTNLAQINIEATGQLGLAKRELEGAFRMAPADPEIHKVRALLYQARTQQAYRTWLRAVNENWPEEERERWHIEAIFYAKAMAEELERAAAGGVRYHETTHFQAKAYEYLAKLEPAQQAEHYERNFQYLRETVRLNPAYSPGLVELLDFYRYYLPERTEERAFYRQQLKRFAADIYDELFENRYNEALYARNFAEALRYLRIMQQDDPDEPLYFYREAGVNAQMGNIRQAYRLLEAAERRFPHFEWRDDFAIVPPLKAKDWLTVYELTTRRLEADPETIAKEPYIRALQVFSAEKIGHPEAERLWEGLLQRAQEEGGRTYLESAAEALYLDFDQPERAAEIIGMAERMLGPDEYFHPLLYVIAAEIARERGDMRRVKHYMTTAVSLDDEDIRVARFMAELSDAHPELVREIRQDATEKRAEHDRRMLLQHSQFLRGLR